MCHPGKGTCLLHKWDPWPHRHRFMKPLLYCLLQYQMILLFLYPFLDKGGFQAPGIGTFCFQEAQHSLRFRSGNYLAQAVIHHRHHPKRILPRLFASLQGLAVHGVRLLIASPPLQRSFYFSHRKSAEQILENAQAGETGIGRGSRGRKFPSLPNFPRGPLPVRKWLTVRGRGVFAGGRGEVRQQAHFSL